MLNFLDVDSYLILQYDVYLNIFTILYNQVFDSNENKRDILKKILSLYIKTYSTKYLVFTNMIQKYFKIEKIVRV
jgi:hypothetical protein